MRAVFDVKKRKSVLKLIVALSLPLFVWLSASAQTTSAEKPSIKWFVKSTVGPSSLFLYGPLSAALGTATNSPEEYGPHWDGFGKRYGMRLTGVSTGNAMEAGLGAIWGEDPRYARAGDRTAFKSRVGHVVKWTFVAPDRDGALRPAYARYIGIAGNNFLSNAWREPSESDTGHALERIAVGFSAHMGGNAFRE